MNVGLDRWFALRTQQIVSSSQNVAQAYLMENATYLQGQTVSMANDLERNRTLYSLDRTGFADLDDRGRHAVAALRPSPGRFFVRVDGSAIAQADIKTERRCRRRSRTMRSTRSPMVSRRSYRPAVTNLVGAVIKLDDILAPILYTVRAVDPRVMNAMRMVEENTS